MNIKFIAVGLLVVGLSFLSLLAVAQGNLTPPGSPVPTMKSLDQIEPRKPITLTSLTISAPGSYYFTSNIVVAVSGTGLIINASDVDVDLGGFALVGASGAGAGILINGTRTNINIHNGTVRNWPAKAITHNANLRGCRYYALRLSNNLGGLDAGADASVEDCVVTDSPGDDGIGAEADSRILRCTVVGAFRGIFVGGSDSLVQNCITASNSSTGILIGGSGIVEGCIATANAGGISVSVGSQVRKCRAYSNTGIGIVAGSQSLVADCLANLNSTLGISVLLGSTVNGCTSSGNSADGIACTDDCSIVGNTCVGNIGSGIHVALTFNRVEGNHCADNGVGIKVDSGSQNVVIRNTVGGGGYSVPAGNMLGPILTSGAAVLTNNNPHANYSF